MQKMVLTTDRDRLKTLLIETITLLCKNGLDFQKEFSVDALIGITLDQSDVFLVSIKETVKYGNDRAEESSLAHGELNGEKLSDASLPAERVTADFSTNSSLQKPANCPINLDCIVSAENDDPDGRLLPVSALRRKHRTDSGKSYSSPVLLSPGDARVESPSVDGDACNVENVLPNVSSQRFLPEEPPRKRQCPSPSSQKKSADQQAIIQDFITQCKSEPVEVIKLENSPVNDSSDQQEDSNFVYDASYGPEMNHGLDPAAFMNWYGHDNLNSASLPGCSSWPSNGPPTSSSSKNLLDQGSSWSKNLEEVQSLFSPLNWKKDDKGRTNPLAHWTNSIEGKKYPFKCSLCDKQVKLLRDLRAHMATKHNLEKDFACSVCGSQFTYKHNLLCHLRTVHGLK